MRTIFVLLGLLAASVTVNAQTLTSPDGNFKMQFHLSRPTETSRCSFIYQTKANQSIR